MAALATSTNDVHDFVLFQSPLLFRGGEVLRKVHLSGSYLTVKHTALPWGQNHWLWNQRDLVRVAALLLAACMTTCE